MMAIARASLLARLGAVIFATGCANVLGLDDFGDRRSDNASSSGGPGAGGATSSSGAGAGGGTAGAGGSADDYTCDSAEEPFEIFSEAELDSYVLNEEDLELIPSPDDGWVHLALSTGGAGANTIIVRSVREADQLGPIVQWSDPGGHETRFGGGFMRVGQPVWYGIVAGQPGQLIFTQSGAIPNAPPVVQSFPTTGCEACATGTVEAVHVASDAGDEWYAATCSVAPNRFLCAGDVGTMQATVVISGPSNNPSMHLMGYGYASGTHFMVLSADNLSDQTKTWIRYGTSSAQLGDKQPLDLVPSGQTYMLRVARTPPPGDGIFLLAGGFDFAQNGDLFPADLWSAVIAPADFGRVSMSPEKFFTLNGTFHDESELGAPSVPMVAYGGLVSAGATTLDPAASRVRLNWWSADGKPRVLGAVVDEVLDPAGGRHTAAAAAPGNLARIMVVWLRKASGGAFSVRGRFVKCKKATP